jgi:hypothetical protein
MESKKVLLIYGDTPYLNETKLSKSEGIFQGFRKWERRSGPSCQV